MAFCQQRKPMAPPVPTGLLKSDFSGGIASQFECGTYTEQCLAGSARMQTVIMYRRSSLSWPS